ncbi:hypothetical protein ACTSKR_02945 [Chitinibacteraceae bacterium HSL-7]
MKLTALLPALLLASALSVHASGDTAKPAAQQEGNPFTEERTKAAANLSTQVAILKRMQNACVKTGKTPKDATDNAAQKWEQKNAPYLRMHAGYISGLLSSIEEVSGADARKKALSSMVSASEDHATTAIKSMIEKDGAQMACKKYFGLLEGGEFDIKPGSPDYATLKGMLDYAKAK